MIWPLQAIIGYGTKGTIYCPSPCSCLTPWPVLCCLYSRRSRLAPCLPPLPIPHFLLCFLWAFPQRGPLLLLSLYLWSEASGKQGSVSASLHHIQSSRCLFSSPPFPPSLHPPLSHPPSSPCSLCLSSKPQHRLSQSYIFPFLSISLQLFSSPTILPLLDAFSSYISSLPHSVFVLEDAVPFVLWEIGGEPSPLWSYSIQYLHHTWCRKGYLCAQISAGL